MFRRRCRFLINTLMLITLIPLQSTAVEVERLQLKNNTLALELTPAIGGRVLSVALAGQPNFLLVSDEVNQHPNPTVTAQSDNIGYLGHEIWLGPQSQWWQQQELNAERRAAKAMWPPDPYLILSHNKVQEKNTRKVVLQSPASPVSGVVLEKRFALVDGNPNQIQLQVSARNSRATQVSWDIWFNTRVPHTSYVYVPVAAMSDVRIANFTDATFGPLTAVLDDGLLSLDNSDSPTHQGRKGKVFIQPAQGWLAAFREQQLLIIQFPLQPKTAIHPEQGQVELYQQFLTGSKIDALLELEVHAPFKTLAPQASMSATETWWLLPYSGEHNRAAHSAFLRQVLHY